MYVRNHHGERVQVDVIATLPDGRVLVVREDGACIAYPPAEVHR